MPESIPLIDVTVSYSSSQVHPCPGHLVFTSGNSSQLMPSALQPFFNSCLVSSLMLYFEVVRSYPRRGRALASTTPVPRLLALPSLLSPYSRCSIYSLNLGTVTISVHMSNCKCFSPAVTAVPIPRSFTLYSPPSRPIRHRLWQAACIVRSTLIRSPPPTRLHH